MLDKNHLMKFPIIFRFTDNGLAARSAHYPEINVTGHTFAEVEDKMHDAIREHIEELQAQHKWNDLFEPKTPVLEPTMPVPAPQTRLNSTQS